MVIKHLMLRGIQMILGIRTACINFHVSKHNFEKFLKINAIIN